jgi:hypothetical protein
MVWQNCLNHLRTATIADVVCPIQSEGQFNSPPQKSI